MSIASSVDQIWHPFVRFIKTYTGTVTPLPPFTISLHLIIIISMIECYSSWFQSFLFPNAPLSSSYSSPLMQTMFGMKKISNLKATHACMSAQGQQNFVPNALNTTTKCTNQTQNNNRENFVLKIDLQFQADYIRYPDNKSHSCIYFRILFVRRIKEHKVYLWPENITRIGWSIV